MHHGETYLPISHRSGETRSMYEDLPTERAMSSAEVDEKKVREAVANRRKSRPVRVDRRISLVA